MSITLKEFQAMLRGSEAVPDVSATATRHEPTAALFTQSDLEATFAAELFIRHADLIPQMQREYRFSGRKWRLDFAWPVLAGIEVKVAVETHGIGDRSGGAGRHLRPAGFIEDRRKMNSAAVLGWIVLECTRPQIDDGSIFDQLVQALKLRGWNQK